ncbi:PREDICTED: zinc finger protein aebp2-like [Cyprinodon variegatus]|uniref:zinc finger protein aebp2-like n=1 Tax=Cyprinodon variegatus TaxID=28743 RepID=UPI0007428DC6|nr:PREDICTED: zinc finger protein aebp2-like [Cyprinodon variegatus]
MALLRPPGTQDGSTEPEPDQQNLQPPGSGEPNQNQAEAGCEPEPGPNSAGSTPEGCRVPGAEPGGAEDGPEPRGGSRPAGRREGKPLTRMNSEESICSIQMDADSTASSGRSTPATVTGPGGTGPGGASKALSYTCCWDDCQLLFSCSPDLAEHIRATHVDGQRGGVSLDQNQNLLDGFCFFSLLH